MTIPETSQICPECWNKKDLKYKNCKGCTEKTKIISNVKFVVFYGESSISIGSAFHEALLELNKWKSKRSVEILGMQWSKGISRIKNACEDHYVATIEILYV